MKVSTAILEKANRHFLYKIAMNAALFVLGSALVIFLLTGIQQKSELKKQREYCELTLSDTVALLDVNRAAVVELTQVYHEDNQDMVEALSRYVLSQIAGSLAASSQGTDGDYRRQDGKDPEGRDRFRHPLLRGGGSHACRDSARRSRGVVR